MVIVESPAKAKTIEGYLGKDFKVTSSYGHVRDLPSSEMAIDIENNFEPTYTIPDDKKKLINELKKLAKSSETVYLASDDDREGEAISWHLKEVLALDEQKTKRIVFREITKNAVLNALDNPRGINQDLVNSQQARRVLDRLVGYEVSPILWRMVRPGLSAGRVQSVAVRIVVEREREIEQFQAQSSYKVSAVFNLDGGRELQAQLPKKFSTLEEVRAFLESCKDASFSISDLTKKPSKRKPAAPFTTSTLQQEASRKLGYSVSRTMSLAQRLYESGHITYMRTDSLSLSNQALGAAANTIKSQYGEEYSQTRKFKTKKEGAQEAHEAIRPTNFGVRQAGNDNSEQRLYELIWKRTLASQMAEAQIEKTTASITISTTEEILEATGEVIIFDGFLKLYIESTDDENDDEKKGMLPPLTVGQNLDLDHIHSREVFTKHPPRYTEASLVKKLEEMGIGRPSTYAPTISTIQKRNYVVKESTDGNEREYKDLVLKDGTLNEQVKKEITGAEKNKLFPTDVAMIVNDFLLDHFPTITDYSFTSDVEKEFDEIATGSRDWNNMINGFYGDFHSRVEESSTLTRADVRKDRELGVDPKTGNKVYAKLGRFGPIIQIGETESEEKPQFASLLKDQRIETITLEEALELFKLPRPVGNFEDEEVIAAIGRFGPYLRHKGKFYSLTEEDDPHTVALDRSIEIIKAKRELDASRTINEFEGDPLVQVLNGRYGPYIKVGKKNVKIPKDKEPASLTREECLDLAEKAPEKKGRGRGRSRKK